MMDLAAIRRLAIIAMFSDDVLMDRLVLKGGNALTLIYGLGSRASVDVDFSIEGDFEDVDDIQARIIRTLTDRFDSAGHTVFDVEFRRKPFAERADPTWGAMRLPSRSSRRTRARVSTAGWTSFAGMLW